MNTFKKEKRPSGLAYSFKHEVRRGISFVTLPNGNVTPLSSAKGQELVQQLPEELRPRWGEVRP